MDIAGNVCFTDYTIICVIYIYIYIYIYIIHIFNLSKRVLSETEIKILEKGLDYAPIQRKINEPQLKNDFEEFCRRMRIK